MEVTQHRAAATGLVKGILRPLLGIQDGLSEPGVPQEGMEKKGWLVKRLAPP
jgi:hypothetical protein